MGVRPQFIVAEANETGIPILYPVKMAVQSMKGLTLAAMLLGACDRPRQALAGAECEAVAAVLDTLVSAGRARQIVLAESTLAGPRSRALDEQFGTIPGLTSSTRASFLQRSLDTRAACRPLSVQAPVTYVSEQSVEALYQGDTDAYWREFYAHYAGAAGFTRVSRAGLSTDERQALVLVEHGCGSLCGSVVLVLLERSTDEVWRVRHTKTLLVS